MHWFIAINIPTPQLNILNDAALHVGGAISYVGSPGENEVSGINYSQAIDQPIFTFSGVKLLRQSTRPSLSLGFIDHPDDPDIDHMRMKIKKSFAYNYPTRFDQRTAKIFVPMLNDDAYYFHMKDAMDLAFNEDMFVKPTSDLKEFNAGILSSGETVKDYVSRVAWMKEHEECDILLSSPKQIDSEYRFFVVDGEVISGSRYTLHGEISVSSIVPDTVLSSAKDLAQRFEPDAVFTMDLALLPNGEVKVVEHNCINISGTYACDMVKVLGAIKDREEHWYNLLQRVD